MTRIERIVEHHFHNFVCGFIFVALLGVGLLLFVTAPLSVPAIAFFWLVGRFVQKRGWL